MGDGLRITGGQSVLRADEWPRVLAGAKKRGEASREATALSFEFTAKP
jgi:hypothetical protein